MSDVQTPYELEKTILCFLIHEKHKELPELLELINDKAWTKDNQRILKIIRNYSLKKNPGGTALDVLTREFKPLSWVVEISEGFVPGYIAKEAIDQLAHIQESSKYQHTLKQLIGQPVSVVKEELHKLSKTPSIAFKPKSLMDTAKERVVERRLESVAPSTGYLELDRFIKGFIPGHIYVMSGDTNVGKSAMALNFVHRISIQNKTSLYFSLEPENTVVDYLASIRLRKRFSNLTDEDILYEDKNIHVFGKEQIREIEDLVRAVRSLPRYDLIVIDHIGYFTAGTSNMTSKQSDVMKHLAGLAKERQCALMIIQHLNKSKVDKGSPENSITGSAAFKQDATDVLMLIRDKEEEDTWGTNKDLNSGAILIRKSKSENPQGAVPIKFVEGSALILDGSEVVQQAIDIFK